MYNVQNSVFCPRSPHFVILTLEAPLVSNFQKNTRGSTKPKFSPRDQHVLSFSHWAHCFLAIFSKVPGLSKTTFSVRDQHGLPFPHWVRHFEAIFIKVHGLVHNSVFSPRSARFAIFALGALLFSNFQENVLDCVKQRFQSYISTFCQLDNRRTIFSDFHQSARVCTKQRFQPPRSPHFVIFALGALLVSVFSKVQNCVFSLISARFVIFALGALLITNF